MLYAVKKIAGHLLYPLPLGLEMLVLGLVLTRFIRRKRAGWCLIVAGTLWLAVIGYPWLPSLLVPPLERGFRPLVITESLTPRPTLVMVPGMGLHENGHLPANLRFPPDFVERLLEAVRLHRLLPGSRIVVSVSSEIVPARERRRALHEFMGILGVDHRKVEVVTECRDTDDEIRAFKKRAGTARVCLVSTAMHLRRAMIIAENYGLAAVPAPCALMSNATVKPFNVLELFPSLDNLKATERAMNEYLGIAFESSRALFLPR